jgi:replication-associated recombination protein RarA
MTDFITPAFLNILIQSSAGDFRIIFNTIEMMRILSKMKKLELGEMLEFVKTSCKDINYDLYQATEKIFNNKSLTI